MKRLCRICVVVLFGCFLAACDDGSKAPEKKAPEAPPQEQRAPAKPVKPARAEPAPAVPAAPKTASKKVAPAAEQVAEPKPPAKPKPAAAPPKPASRPVAKDKLAPAKRASTARLDPEVRKPLPSAKLDLRLPKELVQKMAPPGTEETHKPKPLLPPMFEEKDDSDFRLNGQLLYRDRELGVSRPLEGAELQFEFRQ